MLLYARPERSAAMSCDTEGERVKSLICPISPLRVSETAARVTAFFMAGMLALYVLTGGVYLVVAIVIDYGIRAFTLLPYSAFSWLAARTVPLLTTSDSAIDKAPKIFAARVGFLFALATVILFYVNGTASVVVALVLMGFALLESLLNICVGCLVYNYVILPLFRAR
jgi:hypothetical protein